MLHRPTFVLLLLGVLLLALSVPIHADAVYLPLTLRIAMPVASRLTARRRDTPAHRGGRLQSAPETRL